MAERKVVEYILLCDKYAYLNKQINSYLRAGWVLYGPPFARDSHGNDYYYVIQAMVKYEETTPTVVKVNGTDHLSEIG